MLSKQMKYNDGNCRKSLLVFFFSGFAILYMLRVNLSVAIIAMSKHTVESEASKIKKGMLESDVCPDVQTTKDDSSSVSLQGEFDWNEKLQGTILGYFFKGYVLTNLLGGRLADSVGGKKVYGLGVLLTALLAFLLPAAARTSVELFGFIRFLQGMTEGVTFPAMNAMMASWIPPSERTVYLARILGGTQFGTIVTMPLSGWLSQTNYGWPSVFYLSGFIGVVWSVFWFQFTADTPAKHPLISEQEKTFIQTAIGKNKSNLKLPVPWRSIFTSLPVYALFIVHFGNNWGFYCLLTELPSYLSSIHHLNMRTSGFVSGLPYVVMLTCVILFSNYINRMITTKKLTVRNARKLATCIANFGPMIMLLLITRAGCNTGLVIAIICCSVGFSGAANSGFLCGFQELAPNFAGTITGLSNTLGSTPGFLAPQIVGIIINNKPTMSNWETVFMMTSLIYFITGTAFLLLMSTDIQPWNSVSGSEESLKKSLLPKGEVKIV